MSESLAVPNRIKVKSAYLTPLRDDGLRVLIDRVWPAGVDRDNAKLDDWMKDLAPSTELLQWVGEDLQRWDEFKARYRQELHQRQDLLNRLRTIAVSATLTLLYGVGDPDHNQAAVVREMLLEPTTAS